MLDSSFRLPDRHIYRRMRMKSSRSREQTQYQQWCWETINAVFFQKPWGLEGYLPLVTDEVFLPSQCFVQDIENARNLLVVSSGCALNSGGVKFIEPLHGSRPISMAVSDIKAKYTGDTYDTLAKIRSLSRHLEMQPLLDLVPLGWVFVAQLMLGIVSLS